MAMRSVGVNLIARIDGYVGPVKAAQRATLDFAKSVDQAQKKGAKGWDGISRAATVAGVGLVGAAVMMGKSFADFDRQMSATGAAAKANARDLAELRAMAIELGAATKFSAVEAAQGAEALAKAGVSVRDILGGALKGALDLAAAGNLDVAQAAEIAATAMTQFGLSGRQVPHIADLLAAAAGKAQGEVTDMGQALKFVGPLANQMGISIEETAGSIALLASNGILGSEAGTQLRGVIMALTAPSAIAAKEMARLGLNVYDAQGQFVGFDGAAEQLRTRMGLLGNAERNQAMGRIFGNEQIVAARILYAGGAKAVHAWTKEVNDSAYAADQANARTDNLIGDVERLTGTLKSGLIESGSGANSSLRGLVKGLDATLGAFVSLPDPIEQTVFWLTALGGASTLGLVGFGKMSKGIGEARDALTNLGAAGKRADTAIGWVGRWGMRAGVAGVAIGGLVLAINSLSEAGVKPATHDVNKLADSLKNLAQSGVASGEAAKVLGVHLDLLSKLDTQAQKTEGSYVSFNGTMVRTATGQNAEKAANQLTQNYKELDAALTHMVDNGAVTDAVIAYNRQKDAWVSSGKAVSEFDGKLKEFKVAQTDAAVAARGMGKGFGDATANTRTLAHALDEAVDAGQKLTDVWNQLHGATLGSDKAMLSANEAVKAVAQSFQENGRAINGNTTAALKNRIAVQEAAQQAADAAQKRFEETKSVEAAGQVYDSYIGQLRRVLRQSNLTNAQVEQLIAAYASMPPVKETRVAASGATKATAEVAALDSRIKSLKDRIVQAKAAGAKESSAQIAELRRQMALLQGKRIDLLVRTTYTYNGARPSGLPRNPVGSNLDRSRWGNVYSFAGGGVAAQVAGPGTLYQWAEPATGGEAFIPRRGDKRRSRAIASTVVEDWLGGQVMWPMASGGIVSFAAGGTSVPLSDFMSRYTPSSFSSRADVTTAARAEANAVDALRKAERRLDEDRRKHASRAKIADDEAAIAKSRRALATATEKLTKVEASYKLSKEAPVDRFRRALGTGIKNTGAFLTNLQKLADRGFRDMALQLLDMGGPEAEAIAAGAVKLSDTALRATSRQLATAAGQQQQLQFFSQISGARAAVKQGKSSFEELMAATGSSADDLAAALKLIAAELRRTDAGKALLADLADHGYAAGGIAAPGTRYRWAEPATGGEALVPRFGDSARATSVLSTAAGWYGMQLGRGGGGTSIVDQSTTHITTVAPDLAAMVRKLEAERAWRWN